MINLTKDILILLSGDELSNTIIRAISRTKECVQNELFDGADITADKITTSSTNPFKRASIFKFFNGHDDPLKAPKYDESWVRKLYLSCTTNVDSLGISLLLPTNEQGLMWINRTYQIKFRADALLLLHFLWSEGAVLLPMSLKLPTTKDTTTGGQHLEYAARMYPETLAFVRKPYVNHLNIELPDISTVMPTKAVDNFGWYSWRLIRSTHWYKIEDINIEDIVDYLNQVQLFKSKKANFFKYPISPKALIAYTSELFPKRLSFDPNDKRLINHVKRASASSIKSGLFHLPKALHSQFKLWTKYEDRFVETIKSRGLKEWTKYKTGLEILNGYLFDHIPSTVGCEHVPEPKSFTRKHIEGHDKTPSLLEFLHKGRAKGTVKGILYKIDSFLSYLESSSTSDSELTGFRNPLLDIDYPLVPRNNSSTKYAFSSENFVPLLQYTYAVESFGWYLSKKIHYELLDLKGDGSTHSKVYDTEKFGYVPVVFLENPSYNSEKKITRSNQRLRCVPVLFIPKSLLPLLPRKSVLTKTGFKDYPLMNHVQQTLVALETGIRNIHIRWLDRRNFDKLIDRSRPLDPICDLWVNTDKSHGPWVSKVSHNVIELIDRQIESHDWFDEPSINDEAWYDFHENSAFGKILTIFPRGLAAGIRNGHMPGPLTGDAHRAYFKKLIFSFDMFCRYNLNIKSSNKMPEEFVNIKSLDTIEDFTYALTLMAEGIDLINHTPHSCRLSVVSEYIKILPPSIIGDYITGHSTVAHVIYYAKVDPEYLLRHKKFQKVAFDNGYKWDETGISQTKAEDINSTLQKAFQKNRKEAAVDFGATSFDRMTDNEVYSGVRALNEQPLDAMAYLSTHICPFGSNCPKEIIRDFNAIPGKRMPCGSCYYSVKTVDHLPRITGHIRSLTDECAETEKYIKEARLNGVSSETLLAKDGERRYLADEIMAWTVSAHCLEQMYQDIKTRKHFLVDKPDIISDRLEKLVIDDGGLESLLAHIAEAKTHAEFFTPQLKHQLKAARNKLLAFTHDINSLMQEAPSGFKLIDEFRGLIRSTCETLGLSVNELATELEKPMKLQLEGPQSALKLISDAKRTR